MDAAITSPVTFASYVRVLLSGKVIVIGMQSGLKPQVIAGRAKSKVIMVTVNEKRHFPPLRGAAWGMGELIAISEGFAFFYKVGNHLWVFVAGRSFKT